ncbi:MAG: flagellar basal body rod C-terminal domain-containing protein [Candidatus Margulisiibacteriota bacterium]|jgi:flagellar basal body rod protein FlgG
MRIKILLVICLFALPVSLFALNNKDSYISDPALYYSVNGMSMYQKNFEALMQNSVNSNTPGYKEIGISNVSRGAHFNNVTYYKFVEGVAIESGGTLDFLIQGPGFFVLKCPWGDGYTRDGRFTLDRYGQLVTIGSNLPVMGEHGQITLGRGKVSVNGQGVLFLDNKQVDAFKLVSFSETKTLRSINGSIFYFYYRDDVKYTNADMISNIKQGYYESSNVSITHQVSQLPIVKNMYDANSKAVKVILKSLSSGIQIGQTQ